MSDHPQRKYLQHEIPPWVQDTSIHSAFFITICCQQRHTNQLATPTVWQTLLASIQHRESKNELACPLLVAMPDHLHAIMRFEGEKRMPLAIRSLKRWLATKRKINWQRGFFDHRLRTAESATEKRLYILQNPVRANLASSPTDWPYLRDTVGSF